MRSTLDTQHCLPWMEGLKNPASCPEVSDKHADCHLCTVPKPGMHSWRYWKWSCCGCVSLSLTPWMVGLRALLAPPGKILSPFSSRSRTLCKYALWCKNLCKEIFSTKTALGPNTVFQPMSSWTWSTRQHCTGLKNQCNYHHFSQRTGPAESEMVESGEKRDGFYINCVIAWVGNESVRVWSWDCSCFGLDFCSAWSGCGSCWKIREDLMSWGGWFGREFGWWVEWKFFCYCFWLFWGCGKALAQQVLFSVLDVVVFNWVLFSALDVVIFDWWLSCSCGKNSIILLTTLIHSITCSFYWNFRLVYCQTTCQMNLETSLLPWLNLGSSCFSADSLFWPDTINSPSRFHRAFSNSFHTSFQ